jgi:hypothetical protein
MSAHAAVTDRPSLRFYVEADLNYLTPMTERPRNYTFDPPPGVPRSNTTHESHRVRIYGLRGIEDEVSLDQQGFAVLRYRSAVKDFYNDEEVRSVYYPEAERVIAEATASSSSTIPSAAVCAAPRIARPMHRGSRRPGCTSITPPGPGRSGCATSSVTRPRLF